MIYMVMSIMGGRFTNGVLVPPCATPVMEPETTTWLSVVFAASLVAPADPPAVVTPTILTPLPVWAETTLRAVEPLNVPLGVYAGRLPVTSVELSEPLDDPSVVAPDPK